MTPCETFREGAVFWLWGRLLVVSLRVQIAQVWLVVAGSGAERGVFSSVPIDWRQFYSGETFTLPLCADYPAVVADTAVMCRK
jgi:uncharacterized protein YaiE (UPF0345 family)